MPLPSFLFASCRSYGCTGRRSSSRFSSLRTSTKKEEDGACRRIEEGGGEVAWGTEFDHRCAQEGNGRRKVEVSELHCSRAFLLLRCTGKGSEVRLFLRKTRVGSDYFLYTR